MVALVLVSAALAGERVELWRGFQARIPFGDPAVLEEPPLTGCVPGDAPVRWACEHQVGTVPVVVQFLVHEDLFTGWLAVAQSGPECAELRRILVAQYAGAMDRPRVDGLVDAAWRERQVSALFEWDILGQSCQFRAVHRRSARRAEEAAAARAEAATGL